MKILIILTAILLTSCAEFHNVELPNGSVISAADRDYRDYKPGDTVCVIRNYGDSSWYITTDGTMVDSVYQHAVYKIGTIK